MRRALLLSVAPPLPLLTMPVPPLLYDLAPLDLDNRRPNRFDGDGFGLDLGAFGPADRARLGRLYAATDRVGRAARDGPNAARAALLALDEAALIADASALGCDTPPAATAAPRVAQLLHDVRGGGLQVMIGTAELLRLDPAATELVAGGAAAARDHAKIMRAGFPALDPDRYAADEAARVHAIDGFVATWDGMTVKQGERTAAVRVECEYRGAITARCLETAAIDRVMYNYVNNAARFAADGRVRVWIFPTAGGLVRWVVHNALAPADRAWLNRSTAGDPRALFAGGLTNGGHGIGLSGCAAVVGECFGLPPADAVRRGHLGARADDSGYYAWFHWPAHAGAAVACGCPQVASLSRAGGYG